jgi:dethiobiotin synthetase
MNNRYFILGTDTDCGKTHITGLLQHMLRSQGKQVHAIKPVASGCQQVDGELISDDALKLANGARRLAQQICPWPLHQPVSPHIAARIDGIELSISAIVNYCLNPSFNVYDYLLIEGAGGLMVPLNASETWVDFLRQSQIGVILVVGIRLGCINHALMTAEILKKNNIPLMGWVANCIDPTTLYIDEVVQTLQDKLNVPCWMKAPYECQNTSNIELCF